MALVESSRTTCGKSEAATTDFPETNLHASIKEGAGSEDVATDRSSSSRDVLRQSLATRRSSLSVREFEFLNGLLVDGDEEKITFAQTALKDESLFFDDSTNNNSVETKANHAKHRSLPSQLSDRRETIVRSRKQSLVHSNLWKAHENGLLNSKLISAARDDGLRRSIISRRSMRQKHQSTLQHEGIVDRGNALGQVRSNMSAHDAIALVRKEFEAVSWDDDDDKYGNILTARSVQLQSDARSSNTTSRQSSVRISIRGSIRGSRQGLHRGSMYGLTRSLSNRSLMRGSMNSSARSLSNRRSEPEPRRLHRTSSTLRRSSPFLQISRSQGNMMLQNLTGTVHPEGSRSSGHSHNGVFGKYGVQHENSLLQKMTKPSVDDEPEAFYTYEGKPDDLMYDLDLMKSIKESEEKTEERQDSKTDRPLETMRRLSQEVSTRKASVNIYGGEGFEIFMDNLTQNAARASIHRLNTTGRPSVTSFLGTGSFDEDSSGFQMHTDEEDTIIKSLSQDSGEELVKHNAWMILEDDSDVAYGGGGSLPFLILGTSADDVCAQPHVLSPPLMDSLRWFLPYSISESNFWLKFSLVRDGASLYSLLKEVRGSKHTILAIETFEGEVFGCFTGTPWRKTWGYYGTGESFLWRMRGSRATLCQSIFAQAQLESKLEVFPWTGDNDMIQSCTTDKICIGGGTLDGDDRGSGFGIAIDADLLRGSTSSCATFANPQLSKCDETFEIVNLEVWTLTNCFSVEEAENIEMSLLFLEENRV